MATSFTLLFLGGGWVKGQRELQKSRADRVSAMLGDRVK